MTDIDLKKVKSTNKPTINLYFVDFDYADVDE